VDVIDVSVIVATRDRQELLREALASIRSVEGPDLTLDLIVIDNGSSNAEGVAREFDARYFREEMAGASAARNAGLRRVQGEFVAFLDDDDVWTQAHLRPQIELLRRHPEFGAVIGQVTNVDEDLVPTSPPWPHTMPEDGNALGRFFTFHPQIGATVVRASVLDDVGPLDTKLLGSEDWDWQLRLAMRHKVGFVPVNCVLFRQRPWVTDDTVRSLRLNEFDKALCVNAWRAAMRVSPTVFLRSYWMTHGQFAFRFTQSFKAHMSLGNRKAARRALLNAVWASAPHAAKLVLCDASMRGDVVTLIRDKHAPAAK
jgi:glycosyltransferase involved in cell wall biosynthesis